MFRLLVLSLSVCGASDGGIVEFLNGETESTPTPCQRAGPRATIYCDKPSPIDNLHKQCTMLASYITVSSHYKPEGFPHNN